MSDRLKAYLQIALLRMRGHPIVYRLVRGAFWSLSGSIASRIFTMVSTVVVARILGKDDYGQLGMVLSTITTFGIFAGFGLGSTANKYIAEFREKEPRRAEKIITLTNEIAFATSFTVALLVLILAPWLSEVILNLETLKSVLQIGALLLFIITMRSVLTGPLAGFEAFKKIAKINAIEGISTPLIAIPCVYLWGVRGAILSMIVTSSIAYCLCRVAIRQECERYGMRFRNFYLAAFKEWRILVKFSLPSMVAGLLVPPVIWISNAILVNQPNGYAELGLFNAANQWTILIIFIPQVLANVMMPIFSETYGHPDKKHFLHAFNVNIRLTWVIGLPTTVITIVFHKEIAALFGKQFAGMEVLMVFLMAAAFLNIVNGVVGTALAGAGRMWIGAAMNFGWAMALILSTLSLVPRYGGLGLAMAYLMSYLLHTMWQMGYVEFFLARSAIFGQWRLIALSILVLVPVSILGYLDISSALFKFILVSLAFIPLYTYLQNHLKRPFSTEAQVRAN